MNKLIRMTVIALVSLWGISSANATPVLSFDASNADITKNYQVGDTIVMELWISGLTDIDLAGFDLGLSFTSAVSSYQSTDFLHLLMLNLLTHQMYHALPCYYAL